MDICCLVGINLRIYNGNCGVWREKNCIFEITTSQNKLLKENPLRPNVGKQFCKWLEWLFEQIFRQS